MCIIQGRSPFEELEQGPTAEDLQEAKREAKAATASGTYVPSPVGYVQRYDRRGHPQNLASAYLREQSRRAQNESLSLFGFSREYKCFESRQAVRSLETRSKKPPIDLAQFEAMRLENMIGTRIGFIDGVLSTWTETCMVGVRLRLQVSR